jgi:hypothetical protein
MVRQFHYMEDQLQSKLKRAPRGIHLPVDLLEEEMKE